MTPSLGCKRPTSWSGHRQGVSGPGAGVEAGNWEDGPTGVETEGVCGGGLDDRAGVQGRALGWGCNGGVVGRSEAGDRMRSRTPISCIL